MRNSQDKVITERLMNYLLRLSAWKLMAACITLSILFTTIMNVINSYLWWGRVDIDILEIGTVDAIVVSGIVGGMIIFLLSYLRTKDDTLLTEKGRLDGIISAVGDALCIITTDFKVEYQNHVHKSLFGDSCGQTCYEAFHGLTRPLRGCPTSRAFESGTIQTGMMEVMMEGRLRYFESTSSPIRDTSGNITSVVELIRETTGRVEMEQMLKRSEVRYRDLFQSSPVPMCEIDLSAVRRRIESLRLSGITDLRAYLTDSPRRMYRLCRLIRIVDVNKAALNLYRAQDMPQFMASLGSIFPEQSLESFIGNIEALAQGRTEYESENPTWTPMGDELHTIFSQRVAPGCEDTLSRVIIGITDITARKKAESALRRSLMEKDLLVKEVHHRVKNNLMVIQSLLRLQSMDMEDQGAKELLMQSQNRVTSMGMIHEMLYRRDSSTTLNISEYLNSLINRLLKDYTLNTSGISLDIQIADIDMDVDTVIPLGLIVNELVSNSLKHGLSRTSGATMRVHLENPSEHQYELTISDNGPGLPEGFDIQKTTSMGMMIISSLAAQINGVLEIKNENGTEFCLRFSEKAPSDNPH